MPSHSGLPRGLSQLNKMPAWAEGNAGVRARACGPIMMGGLGALAGLGAVVGVLDTAVVDSLGAFFHQSPLGAFFFFTAFQGGRLHDALPDHHSEQHMGIVYEAVESLPKNPAVGCCLFLRYLQDVVPVHRSKLIWSDMTCS